MKRYFQVFFVIAVLVLCSACEGDVTRALRHDGFSIGSEFTCSTFFGDSASEKIKYLTANRIITQAGRIYEISMGQKYSNNENCKVADTGLKVVNIMDDSIFKADDGKYYSLFGQNNTDSYKEIPATDKMYAYYELLLKPEGTIKVVTADSSNGIYYVLKSDGNVYGVTISKADRNTVPAIIGTVLVYNRNDYGGGIVDFNYNGESSSTFVRTDSTVYRMKPTNLEECSKFADVKCNYQMMEASVFNEYKDYIAAYNGSTVITTYKKVFSVTG